MEEVEVEEVTEEKEDRRWCVYMHTNKVNGKVYIGQTCMKPEKRWGNNGCAYKKKNQRAFAGAIEKYTWDGFDHEVLFTNLTKADADSKEIELIALYHANICRWGKDARGYNMTDGGEGHCGHKHSDETRKKLSEIAKDRCTDELRKKISDFMRGRWIGEKSPNYGKKLSYETRKLISSKQQKKAVVQIDINGDCVAEFESIIEAERQTNVDHREIIRCCKGKCLSSGGFIWVYKNLYSTELDYTYVNSHYVPVIQFDMDGKFIEEYQSAAEAYRSTGTSDNHILRCCRNELKSTNNYMWRFKATYDDSQEVKYMRESVRPVVQINQQGLFVQEYQSISDAAKIYNVSVNSIIGCCKGKVKSCKGFAWMYKEDYNPNEIITYAGRDMLSAVVQLDLYGQFIHEYKNSVEASKCTGTDRRNISACCCGEQKSANGFMWIKKVDYDPKKEYSYTNNNKRKVIQLTLTHEFICEYESSRFAERITGVAHGEVIQCCKKPERTAGGFKWMYKEDYKKFLETKQNDLN